MFRSGIPESGILRKHKVPKENLDDLLVFGYACKLFRDDEKALYIDQGKHLIPWMCEETLRIDRYDGRGTLSDLKSCEANREGYDTTRWLGLNESERKVEQLCDEERYYSLTSNEEEELLYKEEELKRQKANEFQYNYEDSPKIEDDSSSQSSFPTVEQDDRPFVPRPELDVPADISIPKTIKENARIEKTAMFVSQQGLQMEILIKAKQANNLQFSFMNQADSLYKYYRHVVAAFKSGRYTMTEYGNTDQEVQEDASRSATDEQQQQTSADQQHYLHPSLANQQPPVPPPPPLDNNATTQLAVGVRTTNVTYLYKRFYQTF